MSKKTKTPEKVHKGGKIIPALCNLLSAIMLLSIIVGCLFIVLPQIKGYVVYHVISGSMSPEIPVGSIVYVQPAEPRDVDQGDVIAFQLGDSVITHRVVTNHRIDHEFTTKGDANPKNDEERVPYEALIGKVVRHYPHLGGMLVIYSTTVGKIYVVLFAACGVMLNILASRLRARAREQA